MQQQITPQEQCGSQQLSQPVMLCPVQYVYDSPMILPQVQQTQGDQIQQNQFNQVLINVKNPPPWIQNRPQNQVVYVQQMPNNYQTYIHPQMVQNAMYQPQMAYQIQPMIQDNRQFIQIPNLNQFNTVQNATAQIQQVTEDDKMPILTQMLNPQRVNNVRATHINNVRPTNVTAVANMAPTSNMISATNIIRPITQNQQVQTDIATNTKGRPRNAPPQIITINPMQHRQFLANQKQEIQMNVRPQLNAPVRNEIPQTVRADVPQHIKTKIPSSISVKTINRPLLQRQMIRPFDVLPTQQNIYYNPMVMSAPNAENINRNVVINAGTQYVKPNIAQEMIPKVTMPMQLPIPTSNVLPLIKTELKSPSETFVNKQINSTNIQTSIDPNVVKPNDDNMKKSVANSSTGINTESQMQTEEKLVRNTVFVQARGRILNEKEPLHNNTLKRTVDDRLREDNKVNLETENTVAKPEATDHSSNKYIKVEATEKNMEAKTIAANLPPTKGPVSIQMQQSRISNLQMKTNNAEPSLNMPSLADFSNTSTTNLSTNTETPIHIENKALEKQPSPKIPTSKADNNQNSKKVTRKSEKENIKEVAEDKINVEDIKKKEEKVTVLTHVLEGYIIQESNVAFPIQKPTTEKEMKKEQKSSRKSKIDKQKASTNTKIEVKEEHSEKEEKKESTGHFPWKYLNASIESQKEIEFATIDKDDPFANIKKATVESWTADQLSTHLEKHNWSETASKLLDEEIDGESILLVNKDQLVAIGVSEEHAERISAFAASSG